MTYTKDDLHALNIAKQFWKIFPDDVEDDQHFMMKFVIDNIPHGVDAANILSSAIKAAARAFNSENTTIWLDVPVEILPVFIEEGIMECSGFGVGLIVTQDKKCTHEPGIQFHPTFMAVVEQASRDGQIWHPLAKKLVYSRRDD